MRQAGVESPFAAVRRASRRVGVVEFGLGRVQN